MSQVKSLSISGFKSIRELKDLPLSSLNVLIGANGAGKSNFLSFFRFMDNLIERRLQLFVQLQGGPDALLHFGRKTTERLRAEFFFDSDSYAFELIPTDDNQLVFWQESFRSKESVPEIHWETIQLFDDDDPGLSLSMGSVHPESEFRQAKEFFSSQVRKSVRNWRIWHFCDTGETARMKRIHPTNDNLLLKTDGANLAAYLRMLRREHEAAYQEIINTIRLVAPFFGDFVERPGKPEHIELEWTQAGNPDTPFKAHILSDGTLRFMCLATLLLQPVELLPATILIDEPELGLHPYALSVLADIFRQVSEERQLIVSTQSVELVNELEPEDIIVVDQENGASTFQKPDREELAGWLEEYGLGELWQRNILDGGMP
uniref:Predicted ATPase n=1 Tax=Candidatus Kentrum sp. DK TaxID=2126562 RepID=A0A450S6R4_9GAMM|nr:MAG: Predicted ATPase [Candidatus Kentron sp. DK]